MTTIEPQNSQNPSKTLKNPQNPQTLINLKNIKTKFFDQGVHDHDVLVDLVHILGGTKLNFIKIQLF